MAKLKLGGVVGVLVHGESSLDLPAAAGPFPDDSGLKMRWFLGKVQLWKDLDSL